MIGDLIKMGKLPTGRERRDEVRNKHGTATEEHRGHDQKPGTG